MFITADQITATNKANLDTLKGLSSKSFAGVEKLVELNLAAAKAMMTESFSHAQALLAAKDLQQVIVSLTAVPSRIPPARASTQTSTAAGGMAATQNNRRSSERPRPSSAAPKHRWTNSNTVSGGLQPEMPAAHLMRGPLGRSSRCWPSGKS